MRLAGNRTKQCRGLLRQIRDTDRTEKATNFTPKQRSTTTFNRNMTYQSEVILLQDTGQPVYSKSVYLNPGWTETEMDGNIL